MSSVETQQPFLLTVRQAAKYLGLPYRTFKDIVAEGRGPERHPDFKSPLRFSVTNLNAWAEKRAS